MGVNYGVTEYPNTFKRQAPVPLDKTSKFNSKSDAEEYAAHSAIAYEGQIISIVEIDENTGKHNVTVGILCKNLQNDDINFDIVDVHEFVFGLFEKPNESINTMSPIITHKIGNWCIVERIENVSACLNFEIYYPLPFDAYKVFFNGELVSELNVGEEFITSSTIFNDDLTRITIKCYNNNKYMFTLKAVPICKRDVVILGSLYLVDNNTFYNKLLNNTDSEIVLTEDVVLPSQFEITSDLTINLNGYTLDAGNSAFKVTNGATLTLKNNPLRDNVSEDNGKLLVGSDYSNKSYGIFIENGNLVIESGNYILYTSRTLISKMVHASTNGVAIISGGTFKSIGNNGSTIYLLNIDDGTNGIITVSGGTFYGQNPKNGDPKHSGNSFVADGYVSKETSSGSNVYKVTIESSDL